MKLSADKKEVGKRIMKYRESKHLTIMELANKVYLSKGTISRYENGDRMPTDENLDAMAQVFGIDPFLLKYDVNVHTIDNKTIDSLVSQKIEGMCIEIPSINGVFHLVKQK